MSVRSSITHPLLNVDHTDGCPVFHAIFLLQFCVECCFTQACMDCHVTESANFLSLWYYHGGMSLICEQNKLISCGCPSNHLQNCTHIVGVISNYVYFLDVEGIEAMIMYNAPYLWSWNASLCGTSASLIHAPHQTGLSTSPSLPITHIAFPHGKKCVCQNSVYILKYFTVDLHNLENTADIPLCGLTTSITISVYTIDICI
jgi:hypothetical protein